MDGLAIRQLAVDGLAIQQLAMDGLAVQQLAMDGLVVVICEYCSLVVGRRHSFGRRHIQPEFNRHGMGFAGQRLVV